MLSYCLFFYLALIFHKRLCKSIFHKLTVSQYRAVRVVCGRPQISIMIHACGPRKVRNIASYQKVGNTNMKSSKTIVPQKRVEHWVQKAREAWNKVGHSTRVPRVPGTGALSYIVLSKKNSRLSFYALTLLRGS